MSTINVPIQHLAAKGVEVLPRGPSGSVDLPRSSRLEAPSSLKWTKYEHSLELGAFSYQVSGYCCAAQIGRYCSFGEDVQIGRQNHPTDWVSTSPAFYLGDRLFDLGDDFADAAAYHNHAFEYDGPATRLQKTRIGNDVWIGHGAYVAAGITIGDGAIVAARAVVVKDVPPYAVVAGNPSVIKKMRVPSHFISPLLKLQWWQFAPWQLTHLDPSKIGAFLQGLSKMERTAAFAPQVINLEMDEWAGQA